MPRAGGNRFVSNEFLFNPASLTIMIVDDHDPIRKGIKRVVAAMGFTEIIECFDGDEALKILNKRPIDLMILDLYMRHYSGFDVLEHIRNRAIAADIPVIVVTGEASKEEIVKAADMGAEDYLLKPFQANDLEKKVIKTLNKYYSPTPLLKTLRKAERLYLEDNYAEALKGFDAALALDAMSARAIHGKSLSLDKLNRHEEAIATLSESIKNNSSYHKSFGAIADIFIKHNRPVEAIDAMQHELEINPKQPNRQIHIAKLLLKEGQPMEAVAHYRVALQENAKHLEALMGMGHAYALAGNLDKALYYFKRVRRYHPTATKALESAMRYALAANEARKIELLLKDERTAHPDRLDAIILLAIFYVKQGRDDEALAVADQLLAEDPNLLHALRIRASILVKRKDMVGALAVLERISVVAPTVEAFNNIGEALIALGQLAEAIQALGKALSQDGMNAQSILLLAQAYAKSNQWVKAAILYRRAGQLGAPAEKCAAEARHCTQEVMNRRHRPRLAS